jgi:NADH-quinone oxidoreductase subunit G
VESEPGDLAGALAGVLTAVLEATGAPRTGFPGASDSARQPTSEQRQAASVLLGKQRGWLLLGQLVERHPQLTEIRSLAGMIAAATSASLGYLPEGANAAGAALAGFVPHRRVGGAAMERAGLNVESMLSAPRHAYILHGIEPGQDLADTELAEAALKSADLVVALTAFADENLLDCCDIVLPIASFAETEGTYVSAEGRWQDFAPAADCFGDSRPGWRVLRVLGAALGADAFDYQTVDEVRAEIQTAVGEPAGGGYTGSPELDLEPVEIELDEIDVPIYAIDALCRRSEPLQQTALALERQDAFPAGRKMA